VTDLCGVKCADDKLFNLEILRISFITIPIIFGSLSFTFVHLDKGAIDPIGTIHFHIIIAIVLCEGFLQLFNGSLSTSFL